MTKLSNYKTLGFLAVLFLLGALLRPVAAAQQEAAAVEVADQYGSAAVTLYFLEQGQEYLLPISRRVGEEAAQTPSRALEELVAGPSTEMLLPLLPAGTSVSGMSINAEQADIELVMPDETNQLSHHVIDALRWTMTEFEEIEHITLNVNGWSIDANGNFVDTVTPLARPESINSQISAVGQPVLLYFGYAPDPSLLVPMTAYVDPQVGDAQIEQIVEQLLLGPPAGSNLVSTIPDDVELLTSHMDGTIANVNFSEELVIAYRLKDANALHVRKAVIGTLTSLPSVYAGAIEIGGSSLLYFSCQNAVMEHPQAKPWAINDEFYM